MASIRYQAGQVKAAAKFVWENNPGCILWNSEQEAESHIMYLMESYTKQNVAYPENFIDSVSTGGLYITFDQEEGDTIRVGIYVNPNIASSDFTYMYHEI